MSWSYDMMKSLNTRDKFATTHDSLDYSRQSIVLRSREFTVFDKKIAA